MIITIAALIVIFAVFIVYRYYVKPKRQMKRYLKIFRSLGYSVYEMPFSFLGLSMVTDFLRGLKDHKDAMYAERVIYPDIDISLGNILDNVFVEFCNPELIKGFLNKTTSELYPKYQLMARGYRAVLGGGMIFSEGEVWKNKRKLLSKAFNFELIKGNIPKILQVCNEALDQFDKTSKVGENTYKYNIANLGTRMFNGVMMKCFFGTDHTKETVNGVKFEQYVCGTITEAAVLTFNPLIALLGRFAWKAGLTPTIRKAKKNIDLLRKKSAEIIKRITERVQKQVERQPNKVRNSFLIESLIYEKLQNKDQFFFTDEELVDEFQSLLIAGTDSTALFLTMMIYYLANNPAALKRLRDEIDSVIKTDEDITYENLKKLTFVECVQNETTRMFGPGNGLFPRLAQQDHFINDVPISKGTVVAFMSRGNHYSPKYFKDPEVWRPERWETECDSLHPFAFIGFSAGLRSCIGKQLTHMDSKIGLIKFIKRYETIEAPKDLTYKFTFMYSCQPFDVTLTKRAEATQ